MYKNFKRLIPIFELICFGLAILFYALSAYVSQAVKVLFIISIIFLVLGVVFACLKYAGYFLVAYGIYKSNVQLKRKELFDEYGAFSNESEKILKDYKKGYLKSYKMLMLKYASIFLLFFVVGANLVYLALSVILS